MEDIEAEAEELDAEAEELDAEAEELEAEAEYADQVADEEKKKADDAADTARPFPRSDDEADVDIICTTRAKGGAAGSRGSSPRSSPRCGARQRWANRVNSSYHTKGVLG